MTDIDVLNILKDIEIVLVAIRDELTDIKILLSPTLVTIDDVPVGTLMATSNKRKKL